MLLSLRSDPWRLVTALSVTETVSWGILYYAFAVLLVPMQRDLGLSAAQLSGAFSIGLLVSGIAGIAVGHYLDRHGPRRLMALGSAAGALLVAAWSQVDSPGVLYAVWIAIGLVMATVLYEPAFVVLAKSSRSAAERTRALTVLTLVGALASFLFMPLTQALVEAHGWRGALLVLAALLAVVTVPIHALALPAATPPARGHETARPDPAIARAALRSTRFWLLSAALFLASVAAIGTMVHAIPFLLERGYEPGFAAFAVGLIGVSQIPGRLLLGPLEARLRPEAATAAVFVLVAAGIALTVGVHATAGVLGGLVLLGMGNGMTTLARAIVVANDYGTSAYGTIAAALAATTTAARAAGPVTAGVLAAAIGYGALMWALAALALAAAACGWAARREPRPDPAHGTLGELSPCRRCVVGMSRGVTP